MVRRAIAFVFKEINGLHQAAYVLAFFSFGSQLLALARDRLLASRFGADATLDIYSAAFSIPDLLFVFFASALSVSVLLPFVQAHISRRSPTKAAHLLGHMMSLFLVGYFALALVVFITAPQLCDWLFEEIKDQDLLVSVLRVLLLQPLLLGLSSLYGVVTQYHNRFVLFAISPLLYNIGIVAGIIFLYPRFGLSGIAWGVVLGALGHVLVQWPLVARGNLSFHPRWITNWSEIRAVSITWLPRALTLSLNQVTLLALFSLGSTMAVGSLAVFRFAFNLQSVPFVVVAVSYSVAAFPTLTKLFANQQWVAFTRHLEAALRHIIFWSVPIIALCIVLRAQLVRVILGAGAFNWDDTRLTAAVFALLIISLLAHAINILLVRSFYAAGDTRTPLIVACFGTITSVGLAFLLRAVYLGNEAFQTIAENILRVSNVAGTEVLVLAAAYTLGLCLQALVLLSHTRRRFRLAWQEPLRVCRQAAAAAVAGAAVAYCSLNLFVAFGFNINTFIGVFLQGALGALCGGMMIVLVYALLGSTELREVLEPLRRRFVKVGK